MSIVYNVKALHHGQQSLMTEILKVIPLIEKHLKPFDGQRAAIQSGRSAAFDKVCKAFRDECETVTKMQVFVDDGPYSVWVRFKICEKDPTADHWNYFEHASYVGEYDGVNLKYTYKPEETVDMCNGILGTTLDDLHRVKVLHKDALAALETVTGSVPYQFKGIFS